MNRELLLQHFDRISEAPDSIPRLRRFILDLAVRGKLVEQDSNDEPAAELLKRIQAEKARLVKEGKIKKTSPLLPVEVEYHPFQLPTNWLWSRLGEVGDWGSGSTPPRGNSDYYGNDVAWLKSGELGDSLSLSGSEERVTNLALEKCSFRLNKPGDILIAMYGATIGKLAILAEPAVTNQAVCGCTPFSGVFNKYLFLFLLSRREDFHGQSEGGAQPNISKVKIVSSPLALPPLAEQHRIVAKVDELMALCDQLEAERNKREARRDRLVASSLNRISTTTAEEAKDATRFHLNHLPRLTTRTEHIKQLRQMLLDLVFKGLLSERWPDDGLGVDLIKEVAEHWQEENAKIRKSKSPEITDFFACEPAFPTPDSWGWARLHTLCEQIGDIDHKMPRAVPSGVPFLSAKDLKDNGELDFSNPKYISEEDFIRLSRKVLPRRDDIIYSRIGAKLGKARLVEVDTQFLISYSCCLVRPLHKIINKHFLQIFLDSHLALRQAHLGVKSIGVPDLGLGEIKAYRIPLPPLAEQFRIVAKVDELMALCDQMEVQLTTTEADSRRLLEAVLRDALNASAMTN